MYQKMGENVLMRWELKLEEKSMFDESKNVLMWCEKLTLIVTLSDSIIDTTEYVGVFENNFKCCRLACCLLNYWPDVTDFVKLSQFFQKVFACCFHVALLGSALGLGVRGIGWDRNWIVVIVGVVVAVDVNFVSVVCLVARRDQVHRRVELSWLNDVVVLSHRQCF